MSLHLMDKRQRTCHGKSQVTLEHQWKFDLWGMHLIASIHYLYGRSEVTYPIHFCGVLLQSKLVYKLALHFETSIPVFMQMMMDLQISHVLDPGHGCNTLLLSMWTQKKLNQ